MSERRKDESVREFLAESEELLETLHQNLRLIEQSPQLTSVNPETMNALFRAAHTLKGMSGVMGLSTVAELSHGLEDVMDRIRMGRLPMSRPLLDVLGDGVDTLGRLIASASSGEPDMDVSSMVKRLRDAMSVTDAPSMEHASGIDPEILRVLTEYEEHRLQENLKAKHYLYEVRAQFGLEDFDKGLSKLTSKLQTAGEVITTLPNSGVSSGGGIGFTLLVGSARDREGVAQLLGDEAVELITVGSQEAASLKAIPESEATSARSISQSIRVDIAKLDGLLNMLGELVLSKSVITQIARDLMQTGGLVGPALELHKAAKALEHRVSGLQEGVIEIRMIPVAQLFDRTIRAAKKIARDLGKDIEVVTYGESTKLDKSLVEAVADPLLHLIRNALDHGVESKEDRRRAGKPEVGTLRLGAVQKGNTVVVTVEDDGTGINLANVYQVALAKKLADPGKEYSSKEIVEFLFQPGFSTSETVTEISGRGVGLDVVARHIAKLNGAIDVHTELGQGTRFLLTLPITLLIMKALIVRVASETYAVPISAVSESLMLDAREVPTVGRRPMISLRNQTLALLRLQDLFGLAPVPRTDDRSYIVVVGVAEKRLGLVVDAIEGQQEIVLKPVGKMLQGIPGIAGASELGNRKTILVLDVGALIEETLEKKTALPLAA